MKIAEHKSHGEIGTQTQKTQVALLTLWHFDTFASEKEKQNTRAMAKSERKCRKHRWHY